MLIEAYDIDIKAICAQISLQDTVNWVCECISRVKCQLLSDYQVDIDSKYMNGLLH